MQTFLPFESFKESAMSLDRARLGKQRVETLQILQALDKSKNQKLEKVGWINHPATKMWNGSELSLVEYGIAICDEWIDRGYNDTCREKIGIFETKFSSNKTRPWWLGMDKLHLSHRAMLYSKDPDFYQDFSTSYEVVNEYWWPE